MTCTHTHILSTRTPGEGDGVCECCGFACAPTRMLCEDCDEYLEYDSYPDWEASGID